MSDEKKVTAEEIKPLEYWKKNAEEDYLHVPISVLRYISVLEEKVSESLKEHACRFAEWKDDNGYWLVSDIHSGECAYVTSKERITYHFTKDDEKTYLKLIREHGKTLSQLHDIFMEENK